MRPFGGLRLPHPRALSRTLMCGGTGAVMAMLTQCAHAEPLISSAGVLTRFIFTDNLYLSSQPQESDLILQILPNLTSARASPRGAWRFYYGPSMVTYANHPELNRVFHVLSASANYALIDDYLGLNITANANQNLVDPGSENAGFNAFGNPDAFAQTASLSIAPVIRFPLLRGDFATVQFEPGLNYVFTAQTAGRTGNTGSNGSLSSLKIISGEYFSRVSWTIIGTTDLVGDEYRYSGNDEQYADRSGIGTSSVYGNLTYPVTNQWEIEALVGYDWWNYNSLQNAGDIRWRLTPFWEPSRNTRIGLGYGSRYGAADYYGDMRYRRSRTSFSVRYDILVSNARSNILNAEVVDFEDPFGIPIGQPLGDQVLSGSVSNPPLSYGYFRQDHLRLGFSRRFARTDVSLDFDNYRWDYLDSDSSVTQNQGSLTLRRSMSRHSTGSLGLQYWISDQSSASADDFTQASLWTQFDYQLGRRTTGSLRYTYNQQNSASSTRTFDANSLWVTFNWSM